MSVAWRTVKKRIPSITEITKIVIEYKTSLFTSTATMSSAPNLWGTAAAVGLASGLIGYVSYSARVSACCVDRAELTST